MVEFLNIREKISSPCVENEGLILETKTVRYKKHAEDKKNKHFYVLVSCPTPIFSYTPITLHKQQQESLSAY